LAAILVTREAQFVDAAWKRVAWAGCTSTPSTAATPDLGERCSPTSPYSLIRACPTLDTSRSGFRTNVPTRSSRVIARFKAFFPWGRFRSSLKVKKTPLYTCRLYSQRPIAAGEEVTITYTSLLRPTDQRRARLKSLWFFDCGCPRCRDPTELNSYLSAVKCPQCGQGFLLQKEVEHLDQVAKKNCLTLNFHRQSPTLATTAGPGRARVVSKRCHPPLWIISSGHLKPF
jgi:DNA-directed RNA polymerase subunit RPC12/RpoP